MGGIEHPKSSAERKSIRQSTANEALNNLNGSENISHYFRASTWPLRFPGRSRKGRRLVKLLNLQQQEENLFISSDNDFPHFSQSVFSRATQLALQHLDLGSCAPGHLSKVLNRHATAKQNPSTSDNSRFTSPPPSDLSSISSDEHSITVSRNGILSTKSAHTRHISGNGRISSSNFPTGCNVTNICTANLRHKLKNDGNDVENGCIASSTLSALNVASSSSSSFKRKSVANRCHHQVRIIDNRLKKPGDEAALLQARRRLYLDQIFTRSCASNNEEKEDAEDNEQDEKQHPITSVSLSNSDAAPTSSILVINPPTGGSTLNGSGPSTQKHVILLTGSSEPSPSLPSSEANELRDMETITSPTVNSPPSFAIVSTSVPPSNSVTENIVYHLAPDKRRHSSFVSSTNSIKHGNITGGALKRCNTSSSVYSGERTPPTPVKSTLKAASVRRHREYEQWRQRSSLPLSPRAPNSSPGMISRHNVVSSDEVETDTGGICGNLSRLSTPMEPICVVNLATPLSPNLSFDASQQRRRVNLLVEGVRFIVDLDSLRAYPDTMLGRMFQSSFVESSYAQFPNSGGTTTCEEEGEEEQDELEDDLDDVETEEVSGTSSVCSGDPTGRTGSSSRAMDDVEHWMAVASTSTATTARGIGTTHSAPASYRSHRGSLCGGNGRKTRNISKLTRLPQRRRQQRKHSQATNTVAAVPTTMDVCLSGAGVPANVFRVILDYYLLGKMTCPPDVSVRQLKQACEYFLIPFNHETVACSNLREFLHEVSNDGAYKIFEQFLDEQIVPQFMKCARLGERECHVVILTDDEEVHWDDEYPPQMPEAELISHIIYSTRMYRFLKYIENREIAKQVLVERGLKKIRIGIEGYPTCKERMKFRVGSRPEAIYNYVQRPFLRMSWEQEENKSRHVDFQCVKSKSVSDLTSLDQAIIDRPLLTPSTNAAETPPIPGAGDPIPPRFSPSLPNHNHHHNQHQPSNHHGDRDANSNGPNHHR